jgi:hypothetical protein
MELKLLWVVIEMDWKEFLRPDGNKILIAIMLYLILPSPVILEVRGAERFLPETCLKGIYILPGGYLGLFSLLFNPSSNFYLMTLIIYLLPIPASYFLSCVIIFLYKKRKN